jgi:hypothetical protein
MKILLPVNNLNNMIYENAIKTANQCIDGFEAQIRYQLIKAEPQSGKTGCYFLTAFLALSMKIVDYVLIYTGNRECELRAQCVSDYDSLKLDFVENMELYLKRPLSLEEREEIKELIRTKISIKWGSELKKTCIKPNSLLIWEESHFAQSFGYVSAVLALG